MNKAMRAVQAALTALDNEIGKHQDGLGETSKLAQLHEFRRVLIAIDEQLKSEKLPPRESRIRGMARTIADTWPHDSDLGELLIAAEQEYLNA